MEEINEWQQIEQHTTLESSGWNAVIINQNNIEVQGGSHQSSSSSTPSNHEEEGISSPMTASSSVGDEAGETPTPLDWVIRVLKVRFEAMRVEIVRMASKVRKCAMCAGAFWLITCAAGAAATTAALVYVGIQRRRRKVDYLLRQKDEKISQLLLQIAHLNEALSSHRKVPVYRIGG